MKSYFQGAQNWARYFCYVLSFFLISIPSLQADERESDQPAAMDEIIVSAFYLRSSEVGDSGNAKILDTDALATSLAPVEASKSVLSTSVDCWYAPN